MAILGFAFFSEICLLAHAGSLLRLFFPAGAFVVGIFLYFRYPILYLGFNWWIAFLSPWVRRLIDNQSGWVDPSPVLLAPVLVMLVTLITFVRHFPTSYRQGGLPFVLSSMAVVYGFLVGLIKNPPASAFLASLGWLTPITFGFHLFVNWREYPSYRENIQRTFLWCVLLTGTYGIYQFITAPAWDRYWMLNAPINTIGSPEPFQIRVFSTLNAPGPFAVVIMAGLLLLLSNQGALRFPASVAGYLAFLLSQVRACWMGWVVGLLTLIPSLKPPLQMRLVATILIMSVCIVPLTTIEPFSDVIGSRLQSLSDTKGDVSYNERMAGYTELFDEALSELPGRGLGFVIVNNSLGANDSGVLSILFSLGWFGTIPYLSGILLTIWGCFQETKRSADPFVNTARAISLGIIVQLGLGIATVGLSGNIFWGFAGMTMAAHKYYCYQRNAGLRVGLCDANNLGKEKQNSLNDLFSSDR
jgi:hypothetical protein